MPTLTRIMILQPVLPAQAGTSALSRRGRRRYQPWIGTGGKTLHSVVL